jgi:hypothetical protein
MFFTSLHAVDFVGVPFRNLTILYITHNILQAP